MDYVCNKCGKIEEEGFLIEEYRFTPYGPFNCVYCKDGMFVKLVDTLRFEMKNMVDEIEKCKTPVGALMRTSKLCELVKLYTQQYYGKEKALNPPEPPKEPPPEPPPEPTVPTEHVIKEGDDRDMRK